jgi:maleylpyruvate isomerase
MVWGMSQMPPVEVLLGWVKAGDERLLGALDRLDDGDLARPSLLPGWTRGHVLAHVARNAEGLANLLTWARTGVETPMYVSREKRNQDIQAGAGRGAAAQREDVARTADAFMALSRSLTPGQWGVTVKTLTSSPFPASAVPWLRTRELWVHLVDLDVGIGPDAVPTEVTRAAFDEAAATMATRMERAVELVASDGGGPVALGPAGSAERPVRVEGPCCELFFWLIGRSGGSTLRVSGADALPAVPAWL